MIWRVVLIMIGLVAVTFTMGHCADTVITTNPAPAPHRTEEVTPLIRQAWFAAVEKAMAEQLVVINGTANGAQRVNLGLPGAS